MPGRCARGSLPFFLLAVFVLLFPSEGSAAVAPVGQLPSVTVSVTPSVYALPIILVEDRGEWKDFGIQVTLKIHSSGDEQIDRIPGNEWEVGVMDPFFAAKGGNEGDVVIVGVAGNFSSQFRIEFIEEIDSSLPIRENLKRNGVICPMPSAEDFWIKSLPEREGGSIRALNSAVGKSIDRTFSEGKRGAIVGRFPGASSSGGTVFSAPQAIFLPACLVATSAYADTRKTLIIRWLEGYNRGIRLIEKNPSRAASRMKVFFQETLKLDVGEKELERELEEAFFFGDRKQGGAIFGTREIPARTESSLRSLSDYLLQTKAIQEKKEPGDFFITAVSEQLSKLRHEAEEQLKKTRKAIDQAGKEGADVQGFNKKWDESREQLEDGRGCLAVIGILSDLQRSSDQTRETTRRMNDFRKIELGIGAALALYYTGYFVRKRKSSLSRAWDERKARL